jgi:hypothetical protein
LFRYAQEIEIIFDEKCGHHINEPQKCGKQCIQILNNLILHAWANKIKVGSFKKFIAYGSDPQKRGEFLCAFS